MGGRRPLPDPARSRRAAAQLRSARGIQCMHWPAHTSALWCWRGEAASKRRGGSGSTTHVLRSFLRDIAVEECERGQVEARWRRLVPSCRPIHACRHDASRHAHASTRLPVILPHGGIPSRLPCRRRSLALSRRSVAPAWTGPCRLRGLAGHEPGGVRCASQEAHTADPCARERTD
jgi:hypothetical protein